MDRNTVPHPEPDWPGASALRAEIEALAGQGHVRRPLSDAFPDRPAADFEACYLYTHPELRSLPGFALAGKLTRPCRDIHVAILPPNLRGTCRITLGPGPCRAILGSDAECNVQIRLTRDATLRIGANSAIRGARIVCENADIEIGRDCLVSDQVLIQGSDQHAIIERGTGRVLNGHRRLIRIGDHVWLGRQSTVMPDTRIGTGSILGTGAILTQEAEAYCIYAGIPARKLRENVSWSNSMAGPSALERDRYFPETPFGD